MNANAFGNDLFAQTKKIIFLQKTILGSGKGRGKRFPATKTICVTKKRWKRVTLESI